MAKIFIFLITFTLAFSPNSTALAEYIIKLKNGKSLQIPHYWIEKKEIKFYWENGIAGIPEESIFSIGKVKKDPTEQQVPSAKKTDAELKEASPEPMKMPPERIGNSGPEVASTKIDVEFYKKQKASRMEKYELAYQRYLEACSRKDEEAKIKTWEEFNKLGGQVFALEDDLRKKNNGVLPSWWKE